MALTGLQIYKMLPQTNCKECGFPTCLAFAMKLAAKQVELADCPYVTEDSQAQLAESAAPPIRLVEIAADGHTVKVGNEVVLFRHEKTFYNRTGLLLRVRDTDDLDEMAATVQAAGSYSIDYVGLELSLDGFVVEAASGEADTFAGAVAAVRAATDLPLALLTDDPAVMAAGLDRLEGEKPLICGATAANWEAMADLAARHEAPLVVAGGTLEELAEMSEKIKGKGVEDLVLHPEGEGGMARSLMLDTQIRRLALKNYRPLGHPTIVFAGNAADPHRETVVAAQAICKYAGFVVIDTFSAERLYPLLVLRENIYTDPQKPIQVKPGLYDINGPQPTDPVLVTTNFSITYFSVANEVESSGLPVWLLVADAEGMSVLTAWAAGKFDAEQIAKGVKEFGVADKVESRVMVLPGHVAVLSGELEEELPDWEVMVGPREAVDLPAHPEPVRVPPGTLVVEAAHLAGIAVDQPCGGQGRCGRCAVRVESGRVRRRSSIRLSPGDIAAGYALACQTVIEGDAALVVPPPSQIERRLTTDRVAREVTVPAGYDPARAQTVRRSVVTLPPPTMDDQTDDWGRLRAALRREAGVPRLEASLHQIRQLGNVLRAAGWEVAVTYDTEPVAAARLIDVQPVTAPPGALWGLAIDVGTTTVTVWLVDLETGEVKSQAGEYNQQVRRGEDVISRIIYAGKNDGGDELRELALASINGLVDRVCGAAGIEPELIVKATISGNSTMMHLLLGIPAESIRLEPFITPVNDPPRMVAREAGIRMHPDGTVDPLPGVASYVGADISAGVIASGLRDSAEMVLFIDVGTNGEMVLGSSEWLVTCACSAGPAFEGAGVVHGMRADRGAIEEVWIDGATHEPTYRVIGNVAPRGICGSGLISLVAEMFLTGILDKGGHIDQTLATPRIRRGDHGTEYVVAWAAESADGADLSITRVDIDNLLRAKAAIFAGFNVLADRVGVRIEEATRVLIGGAFGKYINVEKAVDIGLLPDIEWERFEFLGNTSVQGAYLALLDRAVRDSIDEVAAAMTYVELSADGSFFDSFTSALFLPHTDLGRFPSVAAAMTT
jgi:uncharacterized 2Fe-2S/4Fe-4S cluster protein (DUF4445 family)